MKERLSTTLTAGLVLALVLLAAACTPVSPFRASSVDGPSVTIIEPANFSTASRGGTTTVRVKVEDPQGIQQIALRVDGQSAETKSMAAGPPVTTLTQELYWTPQAVGSYQVEVAAQNAAGEWSQSQPMTLYVVEVLAQQTVIAVNLTATPGPSSASCQPCVTPIPTCCAPPAPVPPADCYDNAVYVADVTVPDGTQYEKGTVFDKTWRLRNIGTCTWHTGYQLVFVGGSQLGAPNAVNIPQPVPPGAEVDITVRMVAPDSVGVYRSQWQMRNPDCQNLFGSVVYALIQVRPGAGDAPVITRFEVVPNRIDQGQQATLFWEYVNGTFARLYPGEQSVGPAGSQGVSPNTTTTYRLVVSNDAGTTERSVTLVVQPGPTPAPPPASPSNLAITNVRPDGFDFSWIDASPDEQGFRLYNADTRQEVAAFSPNTTSGSVGGLSCGVSYRFYLVSFNQQGESWPSNTVQATTSPCGG